MTILSHRWLPARPLRRAPVARRLAAIRRLAAARRPARRVYFDSFFADPAAVEDDRYRLRRRTWG